MTVFSWCLADNQVVENVYDKTQVSMSFRIETMHIGNVCAWQSSTLVKHL